MRDFSFLAVRRVISEPGDSTRYDYLVYEDYDNYMFAPIGSTFAFPQRLDFWEVQLIINIKDACDYINKHKELANVNPNTLLECVNCIKHLRE